MTVHMPFDWDDHAGWDAYYTAKRDSGDYPDKFDSGLREGERFAPPLKEAGWLKVWVPGCGASMLPHLLARHGFTVWASDASPAAIEIQEALRAVPLPEAMTPKEDATQEGEPHPSGELHLLTHDFRTPLPESGFDALLNISSFQGLLDDSLLKAARSHFEALRPGGNAFFSTINVQGAHRSRLEDALIEAGFHIPVNRAERWFRAALDATGIPYIFILGAPMAYRGDERYDTEEGGKQWDADTKLLRSYMAEYRERRKQEADETQHLFKDGVTRIAQLLYNTG